MNKTKTKYNKLKRSGSTNMDALKTGGLVFEHVRQFTHLGSQINKENTVTDEMKTCILSVTHASTHTKN